jgi:hypothetical protein
MSEEYRPFPFRWILPVAQLLLCIAILWPLRGELVASVRSSTHAYRLLDESAEHSKVGIRALYPDLSPDMSNLSAVIEEREYRDRFTRLRLWGPALLNLPAMWLDLPRAIVTGARNEWAPVGMTFQYWRALAWPLVGILLWWIAGRGIEALIAAFGGNVRPTLTHAEVVAALLFALLGIVAFLGPLLDPSSINGELVGIFLSLAGAVWALLGATIVAARVAQWRIRRRLAQAEVTPAPA